MYSKASQSSKALLKRRRPTDEPITRPAKAPRHKENPISGNDIEESDGIEDAAVLTSSLRPSPTSSTDDTTVDAADDQGEMEDHQSSPRRIKRDYLADVAQVPTIRLRKRPRTFEELCKMEKPKLLKLRRATRYMYLLYFRRFDWDISISEVYGGDIGSDPDHSTYQWAYWQIGEIIKGWKNQCIGNMIKHVNGILEQDDAVAADLAALSSEKALIKWFLAHFSSTSFTDVFDFIDGHIDIDRSSQLGIHFCSNIYASFAAKVKLHIDWKASGCQGGVKHHRDSLLVFWDVMAIRDCWRTLTIDHFFLKSKPTERAGARRRKAVILPDDDESLFVSQLPKDLSSLNVPAAPL